MQNTPARPLDPAIDSGTGACCDTGPVRGLEIRAIEPADDPALAAVIRTVMPEFGASGEGYSINDSEVDRMYAAYTRGRSAYFVVTDGARVLGGGGVAQLEGGPPDVCELKKMYFLPEARGRGAGRAVLERSLAAARDLGYRLCYLETLTGMTRAQQLYERAGFRRIHAPMGATGHFKCDVWYVREV